MGRYEGHDWAIATGEVDQGLGAGGFRGGLGKEMGIGVRASRDGSRSWSWV